METDLYCYKATKDNVSHSQVKQFDEDNTWIY